MQTCSRCGKPIANRAQEISNPPESYLVQEWAGAAGSGWLITPRITHKPECGDVVGLCCADCMFRIIDSMSDGA